MTDVQPNEFRTQVGVFDLINPPTQDDVDTFRKIIDHIHLDGFNDLLKDYCKTLYQDYVEVHWIPENNGSATASWWGSGLIEISMQFTNWRDDLPFVLIHECGHAVDFAALTSSDRAKLTTILHSGPGEPGMLAHSHTSPYYKHPNEVWDDSVDNDYVARLNEDFADQFVMTFAPDIWHGTATDVPVYGHGPRFIHYTTNVEDVKKIVQDAVNLKLNPPAPKPSPKPTNGDQVFADVNKKRNPNWRKIQRAVDLGLMKVDKKNRFFPTRRITRGQAAVLLVNLYDKMKEGK